MKRQLLSWKLRAMSRVSTDLYELIEIHSTTEQIQNVLRDHKEHSPDIRISGARKEDVIDNLREAVKTNLIPIEALYELLCESEENGDQHIFFFTPKTKKLGQKYSDPDDVANALWGDQREETQKFPRLGLKPDTHTWADFRRPKVGQYQSGWIGKIYGHEYYRQKRSEKITDNRITVVYDLLERRSVSIARWNEANILELRVPRVGATSRSKIESQLELLWSFLEPAFPQSDFQPLDLTDRFRLMLQEQNENREVYNLSDVHLTDSGSGVARISARSSGECLSDAPERLTAIDTYLSNGGLCRGLSIYWLPDSASKVFGDKPLRVVAAPQQPNEIIVPSITTRLGIDYVINQLC
ncbi:MAG: hypothetical protein KDA52_19305 [Planctomycetaceae bacterium]|nr:hypothetical protein [Planctomycetaceae bacterium]